MTHFRKLAATAIAGALLAGCSPNGPEFTIVSGSENKVLEPVVQDFCRAQGAKCHIKYLGSLDIALSLKPGSDPGADAVWPAASIWIDVFDQARRVKSVKSIAQMPVMLGVRRSKAQELGWIGHKVTNDDILSAVESGKLKFLMTSATQSNSGASAYLAMLASAMGSPDLIEAGQLDRPDVRGKIKRMLRGIERTSGSSGWLAALYLKGRADGSPFDAMWNYEAVLKETNDKLKAAGKEPLYGIYPADGVALADSPLGFVDRKRGPDVEKFFHALQAHLTSPEIQARVAATGRRVKFAGAATPAGDAANNINPGQNVNIVRPPEPKVIQRALNLYQSALRRPSLTAMCLDYSGSMQGTGEEQLRNALRFLFTPQQARNFLVQWAPGDRIFLVAFNSRIVWEASASGEPAQQARLLKTALGLRAGGGTNIYRCAEAALSLLAPLSSKGEFLPAIVVMTDGRSEGSIAAFERRWRATGGKVPVFAVTFGEKVKRSQLQELTELTGGRIFDGTKSLTQAFRSVRGYN